jgi:hypothetical protein
MVESICGQGFAYMHEVEEDWAKYLVKLGQKGTTYQTTGSTMANLKSPRPVRLQGPFVGGRRRVIEV